MDHDEPGFWEGNGDRDGHVGRIDAELLAASGVIAGRAFGCGSHGFVEAAAELLIEVEFDEATIRTGRFGPTG